MTLPTFVAPIFHSLAFADITRPDYADVIIGELPCGASEDPVVWARTLFGWRTMPGWVRVSLVLRQLLAPLIGVPPAPASIFTVTRVEGEEALISVDDRHLDFRCAIGVDVQSRLVRVTTSVRLKGWRGRLYFVPVGMMHPLVVRSMLKRSQKLLRASIVAW